MNNFRNTGVPAAGNGSGASRKALWVVKELGLPAIVKACVSCRLARHQATGKFRVNANGKVIDIWMLIRCEQCGRTSKIPVHERVDVRALEGERLLMFEGNDRFMVRDLAMDGTLAAQAAYRFDWTGTWKLETAMPCGRGREGPGPLEVIVRFELPVPIRVEKLLMTGFGLSRSVVRDMAASGRVCLPMAVGAKAREDFAFFVNATAFVNTTAPPPRDAAVAGRRAVRRRGVLCGYTRRAR
jgi:hypothetical protein